MNKELLDFTIEKTHELMNAPTCCGELKAQAQKWLEAVGTDNEAAETKTYIAKLEEDIVTVDALISLAESPAGTQIFGEEAAKNVAAHGKEIKLAGAVYCDCPACSAVAQILEKKASIHS